MTRQDKTCHNFYFSKKRHECDGHPLQKRCHVSLIASAVFVTKYRLETRQFVLYSDEENVSSVVDDR